MRNVFASIGRTIGSILSALAKTTKFIWDPILKVGRFIVIDVAVPVVSAAGQLASATATAVASVPAAIVSTLLSPLKQKVAPASTTEQPVAKVKAENKIATEEQRAIEAVRAANDASVSTATIVRRFATAVVDGKSPPSLSALPDEVRLWLTNLSDAQLGVLSEQDFAATQRHLSGSVPLAGVPVVGSLTAKEPVADIIRPVFGGVPQGGYSRPPAIDQDALDTLAAAERAERIRIADLEPMERLAEGMKFFEQAKAFTPPKPVLVEPEPRTPMAMSSR